MVNSKYGIRPGHNEVIVYRITRKNRASKNKTKNTPSPQKDALNMPKHTFLMPSQSSVAEIVKYINHVTQKFTVTRIVKGVSTKKSGIALKYEEGKIHIHLNHGFGLHLGRDICEVLGIKNGKKISGNMIFILLHFASWQKITLNQSILK